MKVVTATCKTCGTSFRIDVGDLSMEEVANRLDQRSGGFECPGQHVELDAPSRHWTLDWSTLHDAEEPISNEDYGRQLISEYGKENVFYVGEPELGEKLGIPILQSIQGLSHKGFGEFADDKHWYSRRDSPQGCRFYVRTSL